MAHRELPLPSAVHPGAVELVRILRQPDGRVVYLVRGADDSSPADPGMWGAMAAHLLLHVADVMLRQGVIDADDGLLTRATIIDRMWTILNAEWQRRTAEASKLTDA